MKTLKLMISGCSIRRRWIVAVSQGRRFELEFFLECSQVAGWEKGQDRPLDRKNLRPKWNSVPLSQVHGKFRFTSNTFLVDKCKRSIKQKYHLFSQVHPWHSNIKNVQYFSLLFSQVHPWHDTMLGRAKANSRVAKNLRPQIFP